MEVVAPVSVPIFVMVALSGTDRLFTPSPKYSSAYPTPPLTPIRLNTSRITSLAETHSESRLINLIPMIFGYLILKGIPAMAAATSSPPAPIAIEPRPPAVGVWLSDPINVLPGFAKFSRCS